ncbi:hypothetical protein C8D77_111136 [Mesorhizobium loti]|uniref:Uncharacterized protein n=1 Tax=Rhizobium loti TaxID=381 RepID=A0A8E2W872_RHILI|nr:hypothetical protein [Mesorhizobium loti]PWJ88413.1 hypothetical protein C8D77_111136 [Mesorhizobium loti]
MNAEALTADLAGAMDTALNPGLKVVSFKAMDPETELERLAKAHRLAIAKYDQRISDTRIAMKADVARLDADRKAEKARHDVEMAILGERITEARIKAERDMSADRKLVASCKAALTELGRE